jgi:hypothetical protein
MTILSEPSPDIDCGICGGQDLISCKSCDGNGYTGDEKCDTCWGTGLISCPYCYNNFEEEIHEEQL